MHRVCGVASVARTKSKRKLNRPRRKGRVKAKDRLKSRLPEKTALSKLSEICWFRTRFALLGVTY